VEQLQAEIDEKPRSTSRISALSPSIPIRVAGPHSITSRSSPQAYTKTSPMQIDEQFLLRSLLRYPYFYQSCNMHSTWTSSSWITFPVQ
jgi:hypothetical protein